jgi:hypothetical protein
MESKERERETWNVTERERERKTSLYLKKEGAVNAVAHILKNRGESIIIPLLSI